MIHPAAKAPIPTQIKISIVSLALSTIYPMSSKLEIMSPIMYEKAGIATPMAIAAIVPTVMRMQSSFSANRNSWKTHLLWFVRLILHLFCLGLGITFPQSPFIFDNDCLRIIDGFHCPFIYKTIELYSVLFMRSENKNSKKKNPRKIDEFQS